MREIGSVADDLDVGAVHEGILAYLARSRYGDAREVGAITESIFPNLRHRFWYGDAREVGAFTESTAPNLRHRADSGVIYLIQR